MFFLFSFFSKIISGIGKIFHKAADVAKDVLPKAIELINNFKNFDTTNPEVADLLTKIIPGEWDDILKAKARMMLPQLLAELMVFDDKLTSDPDAFVAACIDELNKFLPNIKAMYLHSLAVLIANAFADGKLTLGEITTIMQAWYDQEAAQNEQP